MKKLLFLVYLFTFQGPIFAVCEEYLESKKFYNNKIVNTTHELWYAIGSRDINYWNDPRYSKNTEFIKCENPKFIELLYDERPSHPDFAYYSHGNVYDKPTPHNRNKRYKLKCNGKNLALGSFGTPNTNYFHVYDKSGQMWGGKWDDLKDKTHGCFQIKNKFLYPDYDYYSESHRYYRLEITKAKKFIHIWEFEKYFYTKGITPNF